MTTIGSLCSGVGGLDLGLEWAGLGPVRWHAETDPAASKVLAHHWPGVPNHGDIKECDWHGVEPVDLVCGGIPCQGFSHAGRRQGTADPRWLWPAAAECLRVLRPRWFLLENSDGLVTDDTGALDAIFGDLAAMGFDAEWGVLPASAVGAPHRRRRLFVLASHPGRVEPERRRGSRELGAAAGGAEGAPRQRERVRDAAGRSGEDAAHAAGRGLVGAGDDLREHTETRRPERATSQHERVAGEGHPPTADTADLGHERRRRARRRGTGPADGGRHVADPDSCGRGAGEPGLRAGQPDVAWGVYGSAVARWERTHGPAPHPLDDRGRLAPAFSEWMMGLPPGWVTDHLQRTAALRCIGNAVVPHVAALAWSLLTERMEQAA